MNYKYRPAHSNEEGCSMLFSAVLVTLVPGAIISVLGNIFLPQFSFTLLGGFAIVVALRHLKKLI